jgi:DNA invertase Pin-like site-specific DNA recombinase
MRAGAGGVKALAPSADLLAEFQARKRALVRAGARAEAAHAEAHGAMGYRARYLAEVKARPGALGALRELLAEARAGDVYLMCMCSYRTPGRACHTYALLDLARELDPTVRQLPEPAPRRARP